MQDLTLSERSIIVTGAAGARVTAVDRSLSQADDLRKHVGETQDGLRFVPADVLDASNLDPVFSAAKDFAGPLWGMVTLVGGYTGGDNVAELSGETLDRMLDLNLRSAFLATRGALRRLGDRGGRIVTISSAAAGRGTAGHFAYGATKAAVVRLTESVAEEFKGKGITANTVQPGMIATPANERAMPDADQSTWVTPAQVAEVIAFLLSDAASGVNGSAVRVTGRG